MQHVIYTHYIPCFDSTPTTTKLWYVLWLMLPWRLAVFKLKYIGECCVVLLNYEYMPIYGGKWGKQLYMLLIDPFIGVKLGIN